mmetsp:Transcript_7810/g.12314  ORF Transcript_7810/g.12314 Transcript_7810/m.12314 type:complete len:274 (-) Transcript_7810:146-967(-)
MMDPKNLRIPLTISLRSATMPLPTSPPAPTEVSRKKSAQVSPTAPLAHSSARKPTSTGGSRSTKVSKVRGTRSSSRWMSSASIWSSRSSSRTSRLISRVRSSPAFTPAFTAGPSASASAAVSAPPARHPATTAAVSAPTTRPLLLRRPPNHASAPEEEEASPASTSSASSDRRCISTPRSPLELPRHRKISESFLPLPPPVPPLLLPLLLPGNPATVTALRLARDDLLTSALWWSDIPEEARTATLLKGDIVRAVREMLKIKSLSQNCAPTFL